MKELFPEENCCSAWAMMFMAAMLLAGVMTCLKVHDARRHALPQLAPHHANEAHK